MFRVLRRPAVVAGIGLLTLAVVSARAVAPEPPAFERTWERTDQPVASGQIARTWIWGPQANTPAFAEPYAEGPGGVRQVQYFDKSRMEINDPNHDPNDPFYVTNGLLVVELMTGRLQLGDDTFEAHGPANVNVAGDPDDDRGPTYATLASLRAAPALPDGELITQRVARDGLISDEPLLASQGVMAAHHVDVPGIDHQVASPFWSFMNSTGPVVDDGRPATAALFANPFYATGYPITEAYWATVKVAGAYRDVLLQCFERRCLTYTPGNPSGFETEAGNVGLHYFQWRYVQIPAEATPTTTPTGTPTEPSTATATAEVTPSESPTEAGTVTSAATSTATVTPSPSPTRLTRNTPTPSATVDDRRQPSPPQAP